MSTLSPKNIFHAGDFTSRFEAVLFAVLSLFILIPFVFFLYGLFFMIMSLVQNMYAD